MASNNQTTRRIAVMISGNGTNLQALMDACKSGEIPNAKISFVLSNHKNAQGLVRAEKADPPIPTKYLALQPYLEGNPPDIFERDFARTRETYDEELARLVADHGRPDLIVLAGFMHILSPTFLDIFAGQKETITAMTRSIPPQPIWSKLEPVPIINLHPALPNAFEGADAIGRAYEAFQKGEIDKTGVMVHRVTPQVDHGQPILVKEVEMRKGETQAELEERIHDVEHALIVDAVKTVLEGVNGKF